MNLIKEHETEKELEQTTFQKWTKYFAISVTIVAVITGIVLMFVVLGAK